MNDTPNFAVFQKKVLDAINREQSAVPYTVTARVETVSLMGDLTANMREIEVKLEGRTLSASDVAGRFKNATLQLPSGTSASISSIEAEDRSTLQMSAIGNEISELRPGMTITLKATDFLSTLIKVWKDTDVAEAAHKKFTSMMNPRYLTDLGLVDSSIAKTLLPAQRQALTLANSSFGWEVGPPGTGKTYTNAIMLAATLRQHPTSRILVVSTTNQAVDDVIEGLDKALEIHGWEDLRGVIARYGNTNLPMRLQPKVGDPLLPQYSGYGYGFDQDPGWEPPPPSAPPRVCAMTIHSALMRLNKLRGCFNFVLIEEASQTSLAHILPLTTLANRCVFVGDPAQLSPVAKIKTGPSPRFMADSVFSLAPKDSDSDSLVMLNEQQRMALPICRLVSHVGYGGKLITATWCLQDKKWMRSRIFTFDTIPMDKHLVLATVQADPPSKPSTFRESSASAIVRLIQRAIAKGTEPANILVITPFNRQAQLLRTLLRRAGLPIGKLLVSTVAEAQEQLEGMTVSTVYSAQGKERSVVIFDPVDGRHPYLTQEENLKLLTVSFSRAKAKLIMFASEADMKHPYLATYGQFAEYRYIPEPVAECFESGGLKV